MGIVADNLKLYSFANHNGYQLGWRGFSLAHGIRFGDDNVFPWRYAFELETAVLLTLHRTTPTADFITALGFNFCDERSLWRLAAPF